MNNDPIEQECDNAANALTTIRGEINAITKNTTKKTSSDSQLKSINQSITDLNDTITRIRIHSQTHRNKRQTNDSNVKISILGLLSVAVLGALSFIVALLARPDVTIGFVGAAAIAIAAIAASSNIVIASNSLDAGSARAEPDRMSS